MVKGRGIPEYVKYTSNELEKYRKTSGSCVDKINTTLHINIPPNCLNGFNKQLHTLLSKKKIGRYDRSLEGIILDIRNIKILGESAAIRFDDPTIHMNLQTDCYVFKPAVGAIVRGTVRHVSSSQIGVIIYRVFNVSIRLASKPHTKIEVDSEIDFRVKNYCLENVFPYIEGELLGSNSLKETKTEAIDDLEEIDLLIKKE